MEGTTWDTKPRSGFVSGFRKTGNYHPPSCGVSQRNTQFCIDRWGTYLAQRKSTHPLLSHYECCHWCVTTTPKMWPRTQPKGSHAQVHQAPGRHLTSHWYKLKNSFQTFGKQTDLVVYKTRTVYTSEWPPGNPKAIQKRDKGVGRAGR